MSRGVTVALQSAVDAAGVYPLVLVDMAYDSGNLRLWSGYGNIVWDGDTWYGSQDLGSIGNVENSAKLSATGLNLALSGVDQAMISQVLSETVRGRSAKIYFGAINSSDFSIVSDPLLLFSGFMDVPTIEETGETCRIIISCENELIDMERASGLTYTDGCQKNLYPGDKGLEFVAPLANKPIIWG